MTKSLRLLFFLVWVSVMVDAQNKVSTFQHTFKSVGMNGSLFIENTYDNGSIVTGQFQNTSGMNDCEIYIYKRNECGEVAFFKTYGGANNEGGTCIRPTNDGGYIVSAFTGSFGTAYTGFNAQLMKINSGGNVLWQKTYCDNDDDRFYTVQQTNNNGYIAAGTIWNTTTTAWSAYVVRTNVNGNKTWGNKYTITNAQTTAFRAKYVEQTSDGGFIVIGRTASDPNDKYKYRLCLMKLNTNGTVAWCKEYDQLGSSTQIENPTGWNEEDDLSVSGQATPDGGFIATTSINMPIAGGGALTPGGNPTNHDILVTKLSSTGAVQWAKVYGGDEPDQPRCIRRTSDGGYIISGYTMSFGAGEQDGYLLKIDNTGNLQWSRAYGGNLRDKLEGVREFLDGGYIIDGHTMSFGADLFDIYSLKTDSAGLTGCNEVNASTVSSAIALTEINLNITVAAYGNEVTEVITENDVAVSPIAICEDLIAAVPLFSFNNVCSPASVSFTDASTISSGVIDSWYWDFGDGGVDSIPSPTHLYASPDTFYVTLTVTGTKACIPKSKTDTVIVYPKPTANFVADTVCYSRTTVFTDSSLGHGNSLSTYQWAFDDPASGNLNSSSSNAPTHSFSSSGLFDVSLVVTTPAGCADTVTKQIRVHDLPSADFATANICQGLTAIFSDQSTIGGVDSIVNYNWNFGDPSSGANSDTTQNTSHQYISPATYSVTLVVSSDKGCSDTVSKPITAFPLPITSFTPTNVCVNTSTNFYETSNTGGGTVNSWFWDFGVPGLTDDTASTSPVPYTYTIPGSYTVTLSIATAEGCADTLVMPITVYPIPVASFTTGNVCLGDTVSFVDSSISSLGPISVYHWDFGVSNVIGDTSNLSDPVYSYNASGAYTVNLQVVANGCPSTKQKIVNVYNLPIADFSTSQACQNDLTKFTNNSISPGGNAQSYYWDFGEAGSSDTSWQQECYWKYDQPGTYNTTLIMTNEFGCKDTVVHPVVVNPLPVANFSLGSSGCAPVCDTIVDQSSIIQGNVVSWKWDLGDGSFSTSQNPAHCFNSPGAYGMSLIVTSDQNCKDTVYKDSVVVVHSFPNAEIDLSRDKTGTLDPSFVFADGSNGSPVFWQWNFGDGSSISNDQNASHFYPSVPATYTVSLYIQNQYGCPDSTQEVVEVVPETSFFVPNTFTPNGDGKNDTFFGTGIGIVEKEMWIYDRWGNEIFHATGLNDEWDGKVENGASGKRAQIDVYLWIIRTVDIFKEPKTYSGHVNMLR